MVEIIERNLEKQPDINRNTSLPNGGQKYFCSKSMGALCEFGALIQKGVILPLLSFGDLAWFRQLPHEESYAIPHEEGDLFASEAVLCLQLNMTGKTLAILESAPQIYLGGESV